MLAITDATWDVLARFAYLAAAILFILALKFMADYRTARRGNLLGAIGMLIAIVFTLVASDRITWTSLLIGLVAGSAIGAYLALTVKMTAMPQMVAVFNGLGGLASALVVLAFIWAVPAIALRGAVGPAVTTGISSLIGWVTFTGSIIAFAKLQEVVISGRPVTFPMQKVVNLVLFAVVVGLIVLWGLYPHLRWLVIPISVLSVVLGVLFVIPIGGADMPVVISLLNSYSGLAAAATGFVLQNAGLIIAGSLVGASGLILTRLMCVAMNRSLANVLFGAVGATAAAGPAGTEERRVTSWTAEDAAQTLVNAAQIVIVPGYGMAVAQAQHAIKELTYVLEERGVTVKFGIHPVAGRMPGHMNVLLAEAEIPYEKLLDMDEINPEFERSDAVLVIGANDVVNPAARWDQASPIFGMPILDVDKARTVMVCKRSLRPGFAGVDNELFYADNTVMLFGDAKKTVTDLIAACREA